MPTAALRQITAKQDNQALRARLEAEAARVQISYKASVIDFMVMEGIQDFSELDYATRKSFEAYLEGQSGMKHIRHHLLAFDKLKQHALSQEFHILEDGKVARPRYENGILYLPYHPDPKVSAMFRNSTRKNEHVWDFSRNAPERMKRQVFDILHYELENSTSPEGRRVHLLGLRDLYDFCTEQWIEDIEAMELPQIQAFREIPSNRLTESKRPGIINFCRRALFLQAEEINWNAHVWYMERFHIQPERMDPANPVLSISFVEVTHRRNRELLKRYIRYGLGITNLSVGVIRGELIYLRSFLNDIQQPEDTDICSVTPAQMEAYFRVQRQRGVQAETYNKIVMSILHFFNHLRVRQLIGQIPFDADSLLQKTVKALGMWSLCMGMLALSMKWKTALFPFAINLSMLLALIFQGAACQFYSNVWEKIWNPYVLLVNRTLFTKTEFINCFGYPIPSYQAAIFISVLVGILFAAIILRCYARNQHDLAGGYSHENYPI